ncbi:MAG TPA: N-acyl homoserine lactonase family protein [Phycisphaerae bacterium]|nr:N-acyl homoserine lactonase family protein [Phycisphaerae bacterium]
MQLRTRGLISSMFILIGGAVLPVATADNNANAAAPVYRIYPLLDGHCQIRGSDAFHGGDPNEIYDYALYIWLVLGGDKPILVDAGISDIEEMNRGAAKVLYKPIHKNPGENCRDQLRKFGLTPDDIGHVLITHLHFDHVDDLLLYRNAKVYVGRKEWELATSGGPTWGHGKILGTFGSEPEYRRRLHLVDDEEIFPGIEAFWVGGHTPGSMAYRIRTAHGWAVITGDTVSLRANLDRNIPPGVHSSLDECMAAMKVIRSKADVVLASHDPTVLDYWPPAPDGRDARIAPRYTIRAIKVGECQVRDCITFQGGPAEKTSTFYLYVWVIEGGNQPIVVDTGPRDPEGFSRGTAAYIPGGVKQLPEERTPEALARHGIDPADVSHVIVTHLHGDHYDYFDAFENAKLVVNRREYEEGQAGLAESVRQALARRPDALMLVGDEEIVPGIRTFRVGCHTNGSQAVLVQTHMGPAVLTGDAVYLYENIETNRPTQSPDSNACIDAMQRIREAADIILPAHDPLTLVRWPGGIIGGHQNAAVRATSRPSR